MTYRVAERPCIMVVSISRLHQLCETITPRYLNRTQVVGIREGYGKAVEAIQSYMKDRSIDAVLAAGSNGAYLRQHLQVPVVTVKVNAFDVLGAITRAATDWPNARVGLVLHERSIKELDELGPWLNIRLMQRTYRDIAEIHEAVRDLAAQGCTVIIGPGMVCDIAEQYGLANLFLYSLRAVEDAFDNAIELALISREKEAKRARLNTIVAHLSDGIAAFDETGALEACNPAMVKLLGLEQQHRSPSELASAVAPLLRDTAAARFMQEERIEHIGGRALIMTCIPIMEQGQPAGSVVTLQDTQVAQRIDRKIRTSQRPKHLIARHHLSDLMGDSEQLEGVRRLARASAAYDATVLLMGESGTGKELVAQGIHNASKRRDNPFVAFNCAALPEALIESELFGYEDGAFTGARRTGKPGLFEVAHTGTIFLDEIGEMHAALQSRLLRVLQERELMKLGASRPTPIDVRVITATHRDLPAMVAQGTFRSDLYFRLNVLNIKLPPLRDRRADINALAGHLLARVISQYGLSPAVAPPVLDWLAPLFRHYRWPGNVRELENLLSRAAILCSATESGLSKEMQVDFPEFGDIGATSVAPVPIGVPPTRSAALRAIDECGGNRAAASRLLGIGRTTLWRIVNR